MSLSRTVFGSEFQMAGTVQWKACFAIVVLVNGWHSTGVADRRCRLWTSSVLGGRTDYTPASILQKLKSQYN